MAKYGLEELKKLSRSALKHVELIRLARKCSPDQTARLAQKASWPKRQVKAAKFLATLRRDYGEEAFNAFLKTLEQVHVGSSAIEQAHKPQRRSAMADQVRSTVSRVEDPINVLRTSVKCGMLDQAAVVLNQIIEDYLIIPSNQSHNGEVLFADEGKTSTFRKTYENAGAGMIPQEAKPIVLECWKNGENPEAVIDFEGLCVVLDRPGAVLPAIKYNIAKSVLDQLSFQEASSRFGAYRYFKPILELRRQYVPDQDEIAQCIEILIIRSLLRQGRIFEISRDALPSYVEPQYSKESDNWKVNDPRKTLDPVIDRLIELGMSMSDIRDDLLAWIKDHGKDCRGWFMLAVAGAKCFKDGDHERREMLCSLYRPKIWYQLVSERSKHSAEVFYMFLDIGFADREAREKDHDYYQQQLTELLADGHLTTVWQFLVAFGNKTLFYASNAEQILKDAKKVLLGLLPKAFAKAYDAGQYGFAAALVQQFGLEACFSRVSIEIEVGQLFSSQLKQCGDQVLTLEEKHESGEVDEHAYLLEISTCRDSQKKILKQYGEACQHLLKQREEQISSVTQKAIDKNLPIRFKDQLTYLPAPVWPDH